MLSERARARDRRDDQHELRVRPAKWLQIMEAYEQGGHAYHATMPTDSLARLRDAMRELERLRLREGESGAAGTRRQGARACSLAKGMPSVAAQGFQAPSVVVSYTDDKDIQSGSKFIGLGLQTAAGVPLQCDEPADFLTFRIGLFGLDKLRNVERTVRNLDTAFSQLTADV